MDLRSVKLKVVPHTAISLNNSILELEVLGDSTEVFKVFNKINEFLKESTCPRKDVRIKTK